MRKENAKLNILLCIFFQHISKMIVWGYNQSIKMLCLSSTVIYYIWLYLVMLIFFINFEAFVGW